jgi:cytochrome c553
MHGLGEVPPIAGRQATYVVRQLFGIQDGSRGGIFVGAGAAGGGKTHPRRLARHRRLYGLAAAIACSPD